MQFHSVSMGMRLVPCILNLSAHVLNENKPLILEVCVCVCVCLASSVSICIFYVLVVLESVQWQ